MSSARYQVLVCRGPECAGRRGAERVHQRFQALVAATGLSRQVLIARQSCFGRCRHGPNVYVRPLRGPEPAPEPAGIWLLAETTAPAGPSCAPRSAGGRPRAALYHGVGERDVRTIIDHHIVGDEIVVELTRRNPHAPIA